jgi:hypothetical protein
MKQYVTGEQIFKHIEQSNRFAKQYEEALNLVQSKLGTEHIGSVHLRGIKLKKEDELNEILFHSYEYHPSFMDEKGFIKGEDIYKTIVELREEENAYNRAATFVGGNLGTNHIGYRKLEELSKERDEEIKRIFSLKFVDFNPYAKETEEK